MKSSLPVESCDVAFAVAQIGGKWKLVIIWKLLDGRVRFSQLHRALPGISEQVLISQLKELLRDGLITRIDFATVPPHVEYELTGAGKSLSDSLHALEQWGKNHRRQAKQT